MLLCILGQFSKYKTPGGLYLEGRYNGGFFALPLWRALEKLIHGGAYFRNFTVSLGPGQSSQAILLSPN